jgi:hypothetical protein
MGGQVNESRGVVGISEELLAKNPHCTNNHIETTRSGR